MHPHNLNEQPSSTNNVSIEDIKAAKIFMIDDEPLILELYEVYLSSAGYTGLFSFTDSVEAIETLRFVTPDLILTDVQMPEVSGNFLVKLIRTYPHLKTVPVIAVTSDTSDEVRDNILRKGANKVIHKPLDAARMIAEVSTALKAAGEMKQSKTQAEQKKQETYQRRKADAISMESSLRGLVR